MGIVWFNVFVFAHGYFVWGLFTGFYSVVHGCYIPVSCKGTSFCLSIILSYFSKYILCDCTTFQKCTLVLCCSTSKYRNGSGGKKIWLKIKKIRPAQRDFCLELATCHWIVPLTLGSILWYTYIHTYIHTYLYWCSPQGAFQQQLI